jgi:hypothetical protein
MLNWISGVWCKTMHRQVMWPIHGQYLCPICLHVYAVKWEPNVSAQQAQPPACGELSIPSNAPVVQ